VVAETFYWFDYETWGIHPQWDKPAQFAGVRTDENLNPIGEPDMLYCQLPPDYLPDPGACRVTGLSPIEVNQLGRSEPQFMREVLARLGQKNTCSVGYNSIRFDDEVTRHSLFRNFHDPYRHEWYDGNSRWDLLDVVRLTRALRPDGIQWPFNDDGKPNNRLENLTASNGLGHEQAHDALSDVYATISVARLIQSQQPRLYSFALTLRRKATVAALLNWQAAEPVGHVSGMLPADRMHTSIVVPLMRHPTNSNGIVVLDMRTDPKALIDLEENEIRQRLYNRDCAPQDRLHLRTIHINRCPMVVPINTLRPEDAARIGLNREEELSRASQVKSLINDDTKKAINAAMIHQPNEHSERLEFAIQTCPEASLYSGGFLSEADRRRANAIASQAPDKLREFEQQQGYFDDNRLQRLLFNYRARHAFETLTDSERKEWMTDCIERLTEEDDMPWRTFRAFDDAMSETVWRDDELALKQKLMNWRKQVLNYTKTPTA